MRKPSSATETSRLSHVDRTVGLNGAFGDPQAGHDARHNSDAQLVGHVQSGELCQRTRRGLQGVVIHRTGVGGQLDTDRGGRVLASRCVYRLVYQNVHIFVFDFPLSLQSIKVLDKCA
jgi:hypothetical protein